MSQADRTTSTKLRALAVASAGRSPMLLEVPTFAEAGYPEYSAPGLGGPGGAGGHAGAASGVPRVREQVWRARRYTAVPERDIVGGELAFLSFGSNHHDLALLASPHTRPADPQCAGLAHVALRIGEHIDTLRAFHAHLRELGVALHHARDHEVSRSLYLRDPDGLLIEV